MIHIASGPLNSPYRRYFQQLPHSIKAALWELGYSRTQPDGELLKESLEIEQKEQNTHGLWSSGLGGAIIDRRVEYNDLTNDIPTTQGQLPKALVTGILGHLVSLVENGKQSSTYHHMEMTLATTDRHQYSGQFTPPSELAQLTKRWRRWKPRSGSRTPATTQRVMELTLRDRWLERPLAPFILKSDKIRHMVSISGMSQPRG